MNNDLISREALRKSLEELKKSPWCCEHRDTIDGIASRQAQKEAFQIFDNIIDNAPTVEAEKAKESEIIKAYTKGFDTGVETVKGKKPQGEPVIKCQDCKYRVKEWREDRRTKEKGYWVYGCKHFGEIIGFWGFGGNDNEFCSDAERKSGADK